MVKKILKYPNEHLRTACLPVTEASLTAELIEDLSDTLEATPNGLAISANQIQSDLFRIFVVKDGLLRKTSSAKMEECPLPHVVINPSWSERKVPEEIGGEGCLSFPGITVPVPRFQEIYASWEDVHGEKHETILEGLWAVMFQQECDHLDGRLLIDYLPKPERIALHRTQIQARKAGR